MFSFNSLNFTKYLCHRIRKFCYPSFSFIYALAANSTEKGNKEKKMKTSRVPLLQQNSNKGFPYSKSPQPQKNRLNRPTLTQSLSASLTESVLYKKRDRSSPYKSSAFVMTASRLGRGWKSWRRRKLCDDGRIRAARALLTKSPSTVPIRTNEFVIADRRIFN